MLSTIHDEMFNRNYRYLMSNPAEYDPEMETSSKRCIALVAQGPLKISNTSIFKFYEKYSEYAVMPNLHHTFLILRGWKLEHPPEDFTQIKDELVKYSVVFNRLVPTKTGCALVGTPSCDINSIRDNIRKLGYSQDAPYKLDICHLTLFRWIKPVPRNIQTEFLNELSNFPIQGYLKLDVTQFQVTKASLTMRPKDITTLATFTYN